MGQMLEVLYPQVMQSIVAIASQTSQGKIPQHIMVWGAVGAGKTVFIEQLAQQLHEGSSQRDINVLTPPHTYVRSVDDMDLEPSTSGTPAFLLVDDFDALLRSFDIEAQYSLRSKLTRPGAPMLIGTCSMMSKAMTDYKMPLYDAFRLFRLNPEAGFIQHFLPDSRYQELIKNEDWDSAEQLIGDNLYYMTDVAHAFSQGKTLEQCVDDALRHNERYFKQLFDSLAALQQQILVGIARHHEAATLQNIRQLGGVNDTSCTTALKRLMDRAIIRQVGQHKRNYSYAMIDSLFAEWIRRCFDTH